jgi:hypothetical protein
MGVVHGEQVEWSAFEISAAISSIVGFDIADVVDLALGLRQPAPTAGN